MQKNRYTKRAFFILAILFTGAVLAIPAAGAASGDDGRLPPLSQRFQTLKQAAQADVGAGPRSVSKSPIPERPEVQVRLRRDTQTPRQIKGALLQKGVSGPLPRKKRDLETVRAFLRENRSLLRIQDPDAELLLSRQESGPLDHRHLRFSQFYQGIPVWPGELMVHLNAKGDIYLAEGAYVPTPRKVITVPALDSEAAIQKALSALPQGEAEVAGSPELIIYAPGDRRARLAWKITFTLSLYSRWRVIVDAANGEVLSAHDIIPKQGVSGMGIDLSGNQRDLSVWSENSQYYMVDTSKSMYDPASDPPLPDSVDGGIVILDARNQPPTSDVRTIPRLRMVRSDRPDAGWLADAVSAAYHVSQTYDYFLDRHDRDSIDGHGSTIVAVVRLGEGYENASWSSETRTIYLGDGQPFAAAPDVVAHELTHGITAYTANLIYRDQSGALNEAFSDIFGEMVQARMRGGAADWLFGDTLSQPLRSLSDPEQLQFLPGYPYPERMSEYFNTSQDNGGVHINMTIITHAFYLLAEGLDGGIGIQDAAAIFYRALNYHLLSNSQFVDARLACISSAEELFGVDSAQAQQTAQAFDAVEVYDSAPTPEEGPYYPPASGEDAALFVYYDNLIGGFRLGRRNSADPTEGVPLSRSRVSQARPSVTRDGSMAVFVDYMNDLCLINTDGTEESCMGWNDVSSVAVSPDGRFYGFVFRSPSGGAENKIAVFDLNSDPVRDGIREYTLAAPVYDEEVSFYTVVTADVMNFTQDNRYIIYDAYNVVELETGERFGGWSIYALDLHTGQTLVLVPPVVGLDLAYPALSRTSDDYITFDAYHSGTQNSTLYAMDMVSGEARVVGEVRGDYGTPVYNGDDSAIVYSRPDSFTATGFSLWKQSLAGDRITPSGEPSFYLENADFVTIYRQRQASGELAEEEEGGGCFISDLGRTVPAGTGAEGDWRWTPGMFLLLGLLGYERRIGCGMGKNRA